MSAMMSLHEQWWVALVHIRILQQAGGQRASISGMSTVPDPQYIPSC